MGKPTQAGTEVTQSQDKNTSKKHFWLLVPMTTQPTTYKIGGTGNEHER